MNSLFYEYVSVFGQIENLWMDKIPSKTFASIHQKCLAWIHGSLRMQECKDDSEIYNYQRDSTFENYIH